MMKFMRLAVGWRCFVFPHFQNQEFSDGNHQEERRWRSGRRTHAQQVQQALAIAGASEFSGSTDPAFVGSVLVALAINTSSVSATIDNAKTRRDATGGGGLTAH